MPEVQQSEREFESDVIQKGSQTYASEPAAGGTFESDVIQKGSQTSWMDY